MLTIVATWLFILAIVIQCGYALYFFTRILQVRHYAIASDVAHLPVSVIICAKNEARNLEQYLPAIMAQRYMNEDGKPMYEVIVVNDASDDDTEQVLHDMGAIYPHLRHITIAQDAGRTFKGKKYALNQGVAASGNNYLLFTDADCMPASEHWVSLMAAPFTSGKEIVAGYGAYQRKKGLLNGFTRWETVHSFLQYATYSLSGKPYMAVGRNLACTKAAFLKAQASDIWNKLPSGDDDLLVSISGTDSNTAIVASRDAFTISEPKATWQEWYKQKQRHLSTGKYYKTDIRLLLGLYASSHALCWLLLFVLLFAGSPGLALFIMTMRCGLYWTIFQTTALKLGERKLFRWIPLCDPGWLVYNLLFSPYIIWKNKQAWK